jgi:hypothetical protein
MEVSDLRCWDILEAETVYRCAGKLGRYPWPISDPLFLIRFRRALRFAVSLANAMHYLAQLTEQGLTLSGRAQQCAFHAKLRRIPGPIACKWLRMTVALASQPLATVEQ